MRTRYRNPRIPFSISEVSALETKFVQSPYLGSNDVNELAAALNMSPKRVSDNIFLRSVEIRRFPHHSFVILLFSVQSTFHRQTLIIKSNMRAVKISHLVPFMYPTIKGAESLLLKE